MNSKSNEQDTGISIGAVVTPQKGEESRVPIASLSSPPAPVLSNDFGKLFALLGLSVTNPTHRAATRDLTRFFHEVGITEINDLLYVNLDDFEAVESYSLLQ